MYQKYCYHLKYHKTTMLKMIGVWTWQCTTCLIACTIKIDSCWYIKTCYGPHHYTYSLQGPSKVIFRAVWGLRKVSAAVSMVCYANHKKDRVQSWVTSDSHRPWMHFSKKMMLTVSNKISTPSARKVGLHDLKKSTNDICQNRKEKQQRKKEKAYSLT